MTMTTTLAHYAELARKVARLQDGDGGNGGGANPPRSLYDDVVLAVVEDVDWGELADLLDARAKEPARAATRLYYVVRYDGNGAEVLELNHVPPGDIAEAVDAAWGAPTDEIEGEGSVHVYPESCTPPSHPLPPGTRILSVAGEHDDDDGTERRTGPYAIGEVMSNGWHDGRGFVYGVLFPNGTQVFLDQFGELDKPARYQVL